MLSIADEDSRDADVLKRPHWERMALDYPSADFRSIDERSRPSRVALLASRLLSAWTRSAHLFGKRDWCRSCS